MVELRRFRDGDGEAVRRLHRLALEATGTDPADVPGTDDLDAVRAQYIDSGGEFIVALDGETMVGMGGLKVEGSTGELFRMRVHPDYQRQGIGAAVLSALEAAARERGVTQLRAETARRQEAATQFYPAHGYEHVERRRHGEYTLIRYRKSLQPESGRE